jgi:hypothetical protein
MARGRTQMGYLRALVNYLKTDKARWDMIDYFRAAVIIAAMMAMVRIVVDMLHS